MTPANLALRIDQGATFRALLRLMQPSLVYKPITAIAPTGPVRLTVEHGLPGDWPVWVEHVRQLPEANRAPLRQLPHMAQVVTATELDLPGINATGTRPEGGQLVYRPPLDLTDATAELRLYEKGAEVGTLPVTVNAGGWVDLALSAAQTAALAWRSREYVLDVTLPHGDVLRAYTGTITVEVAGAAAGQVCHGVAVVGGDRGPAGLGVAAATVAENGHLILTLQDGTEIDAGVIDRPWGTIQGDITQQLDLMQRLGLKVNQDTYSAFVVATDNALGDRYTKTESDGRYDAAGTASGAVGAHEATPDPHPQYTTAAQAAAAAPVQSVQGRTGGVAITKADVGLSAVDNTADADKPVSTAQATALAGKADAVQDNKDILLDRINFNRNWIYPWGGRGVAVFGDSISQMAFSRDAYRNNWTNILKRCVNAEFNASSYGFVSLLPTLGSGSTASYEIHSVVRSGTWTELTAENAEWSISGFALESSTPANTLTVTVPSFQNYFGVWYHEFSGGGTFEILVNGAVKMTVDTDGSAGSTRTSGLNGGRLDVEDNGQGSCVITLRVVSGAVRLIGISYENAEYDFQLSNFSQSGRRLRYISQEVIQKTVRGSTTFILALGYNDNATAESDPAYLAAVKQRIDWIIEEANTYGVRVLVLDFLWQRGIDRALPIELKRCADSIAGSSYIKFGDYLKTDGSLVDSSWLTDSIRLFDDSAHPNILGHKLIGETVAKKLRLSVNSKRQALDYYDWWMPLKLPGDMRNTFTSPLRISAMKRVGDVLYVRLYLYNNTVDNSTTAVPSGTYDILAGADLPGDVYVPDTTFYPLTWNTDNDESVTPYFSALLEARFARNGLRLIVKNTTKRNIEGVIPVAVFRSEINP